MTANSGHAQGLRFGGMDNSMEGKMHQSDTVMMQPSIVKIVLLVDKQSS